MLDDETYLMGGENSQKTKILLAEDDASMRRFLEITLQRADYTVISAEDGLAALKIALAESFDAVVADALMPNMTGHDLCRMLKQNPVYKNAPFIILSGLEQEISASVTGGCADAYLVKGADLKEELIDLLARSTAEKTA